MLFERRRKGKAILLQRWLEADPQADAGFAAVRASFTCSRLQAVGIRFLEVAHSFQMSSGEPFAAEPAD